MASLSLHSVKNLLDGRALPVLGLGTYLGAPNAVRIAMDLGYRLIDTASLYENEEDIGQEVKKSGIPRKDIFIVTKVWNSDHGESATIKSLKDSLKRLKMDYVDLFLMHSPGGGKVLETWDAMIQLREQGLTKYCTPL
jgi:diketogulonate reductase-like aldo/keto reductase